MSISFGAWRRRERERERERESSPWHRYLVPPRVMGCLGWGREAHAEGVGGAGSASRVRGRETEGQHGRRHDGESAMLGRVRREGHQ
eukprot:scaffold28795_cov146-Isochrysis_galbana.AAC.1